MSMNGRLINGHSVTILLSLRLLLPVPASLLLSVSYGVFTRCDRSRDRLNVCLHGAIVAAIGRRDHRVVIV